jgi:hypothetical protein
MPRTTQTNQGTSRDQDNRKSASSASSRSSSSRSASSDDNRTHGKQGFASMDPAKQREIAAKGGRHSHDNDNRR